MQTLNWGLWELVLRLEVKSRSPALGADFYSLNHREVPKRYIYIYFFSESSKVAVWMSKDSGTSDSKGTDLRIEVISHHGVILLSPFWRSMDWSYAFRINWKDACVEMARGLWKEVSPCMTFQGLQRTLWSSDGVPLFSPSCWSRSFPVHFFLRPFCWEMLHQSLQSAWKAPSLSLTIMCAVFFSASLFF